MAVGWRDEKPKVGARGVFSFGYFSLDEQRKVTKKSEMKMAIVGSGY